MKMSHLIIQMLNISEILLTSEARMVTYVSKQNVRSEHSLEEVLQTGEFHKDCIYLSFEHLPSQKLLLSFDFMFILSLLIEIFAYDYFHKIFCRSY
jgi:uncharacterized membrane protein